ncbi:hypothetical protein [Leeuwenhoekiella nanhaiensis]|uniref:Uncharacterized protein n=1 Tax=Leeuwenhoekiella nanhaiensis TaxID=1655491 RepID=A0A2G1VQQ1_9FLAO|nr:hypothetical protein [Leeuwenhoekiella nanhaiensis]PHQ29085.1 hypothetical protein CJ305_10760 [Leeuwenhoekiella nanhaiensis]
MKSKEEKEYEERVKRRVLILRDKLKEGKIHIAEHLREKVEASLLKARFDKNGEPDLDTIDGFVRSMALMAENMDHREKMKSAISLRQIQEGYFNRIEGNFNHFYQMMIEANASPHQLAQVIAYGKHDIDYLNEPIESLLKDLEEFWELTAESGYIHLEDDNDSIKAVFGGDLFPANNENIASKCGIYTDTIILPCPFIRSRHMFKIWDKNQRVYFLLKHALNILQYKELALAEFENPIVAILPDKEMMDEFAFEEIQKLGEKDALYHAKKIFGREFQSIDELLEFGKELDTVEKVSKEIKDPKRVLFDTEFKEPLEIQIKNQTEGESMRAMQTNNPGIIVSMMGLGRMSVCNELLAKATKVGGFPLIDAPTSWEYFKWKLEYDSERTYPDKDYQKMHIVKGLNGLDNTKLQWIGKIPPTGLIELRKAGAINEIREILSKGIDELVMANELDFTSTSHKVFNNLNFAFNQHQENIKKLVSKKWKIAGKDFGSWLVMGSVEIASACLGTPLYGLSTVALNQIMDAPKIKDLPKTVEKMKETDRERQNLKKSPLGLMFIYKK